LNIVAVTTLSVFETLPPSHFHTNPPSGSTALRSGVRFHPFVVAARVSGMAI
jgi:hypothetical protein